MSYKLPNFKGDKYTDNINLGKIINFKGHKI